MDDVASEKYVKFFKEAFTLKGGSAKSGDMNHLLAQIGDEARFDFDPINRSFKSKNSAAKYIKNTSQSSGSYGQGEGDSITHILRGHTEDMFTDSMHPIPKPAKSIFSQSKGNIRLGGSGDKLIFEAPY